MRMKSSSGQGPKRSGVGWVTVATAHAGPPPARLLTRMRSVPASGLQGMGPTTLHSPASRRGRMSELPISSRLVLALEAAARRVD